MLLQELINLARSVLDLKLIVQELTYKGVNLTVAEQLISTKDATSSCLYILSVFSSFVRIFGGQDKLKG